MRTGDRRRSKNTGFTFLWVLFAVAVLGIGLVAASEVWVTTAARHKRAQFDWVGAQYRQAIGSYYEASRGGAKEFPAKLEDLLSDPRYPTARSHLRALYPNPFSGKQDWELIRAGDGKIRGVRALAMNGSAQKVIEFVYSIDADRKLTIKPD